MTRAFDEPTLPRLPASVARPLLALWISIALHAALLLGVRVVPPAGFGTGGAVLQAELVEVRPWVMVAPLQDEADDTAPGTDEALPGPDEVNSAAPEVAPGPLEPGEAAGTTLPGAVPPSPGFESAVDLTWYTARELDQPPRALDTIEPDYPPEAEQARRSGVLRLQLRIESDGRVSAVEVVSAEPPGVFDASAMQAFAAARFAPGVRAGRPVRAQILIEVRYDFAPLP